MLVFAYGSFRIHSQNIHCICQICQVLGNLGFQMSLEKKLQAGFFSPKVSNFISMQSQGLTYFLYSWVVQS